MYENMVQTVSNIVNWLEDFLTDVTQTVVLKAVRLDSPPVKTGVSQGLVLGSFSFLIKISDMSYILSVGTRLKLYSLTKVFCVEGLLNHQKPNQVGMTLTIFRCGA